MKEYQTITYECQDCKLSFNDRDDLSDDGVTDFSIPVTALFSCDIVPRTMAFLAKVVVGIGEKEERTSTPEEIEFQNAAVKVIDAWKRHDDKRVVATRKSSIGKK